MARLNPEYVVAALMQRGVPQHVAQGVVMNFQDESGLNTGIQEASPNVHGTRGFGLAQWTDTSPGVGRRTNLMNFAASRGKSPDDPETQFDFFMQENQGPEAGAWSQVMAAPDARTAAQTFVRAWERPASEHVATRVAKYSGQAAPGVGSATAPTQVAAGPWGAGTDLTPPAKPTDTMTPPTIAEQLEASSADIADSLMSKAGGGNQSSVPNVQLAKPQAYTVQPQVAMTVNPQMEQASRDRLAMAMARLNSGKLWVG